ncbi:perlucin-like [Contarinia nasturtii]|uniref:perlucin-like n=1 Tax=Contarinia nasturtii TaxID=265458 RepID=UPI0012D4457B|nr:perlucin-like [Contarinia nasturtii]
MKIHKMSIVLPFLLITPIFAQLFYPKHKTIRKFHLITSHRANWHQALFDCRSLSMNLVSIYSKEENDNIVQQIKDGGYIKEDFWTSGTKLGNKDNTYRWMGSGKPVNFTDWAVGEPNGRVEEVACIHYNNDKGNAQSDQKWDDYSCHSKFFFICEQELIEYEYCST